MQVVRSLLLSLVMVIDIKRQGLGPGSWVCSREALDLETCLTGKNIQCFLFLALSNTRSN